MATNREKLAKMTNEELANFIHNARKCCELCIYDVNVCHPCCTYGILQWLNKESEESYVNNKSY